MKSALHGYPLVTKFSTPQEIEAYIGKRDIQCLVCGHRMKRISGRHLEGHGISEVEYRARFGLPEGTPLCCAETSQRNALGMLHSHEVMRQSNAADDFPAYVVSSRPHGTPSQEKRAIKRAYPGISQERTENIVRIGLLMARLGARAETAEDLVLLARAAAAYLAKRGALAFETCIAAEIARESSQPPGPSTAKEE